jgi:hypothetical protein
MRIFAIIPALAVLATAVSGLSLPRQDNCGYEVGCDLASQMTKREFSGELPARDLLGWTNAELLRRGLPLKDPIMKRGSPVRRNSPSGRPNTNTKKHRGAIKVKKASNHQTLGYVSKFALNKQQYVYGGADTALIVDFETDWSGSGSELNILPENADVPGFFAGLVEGRDNANSVLSKGSFQYAYIAGTKQTAPGACPAIVGNTYNPTRTSESAVWTYNHGTGALTPYWVNPDKSIPKLCYFAQGTALYVGGDSAAFLAHYPAPITDIEFEFVPI